MLLRSSVTVVIWCLIGRMGHIGHISPIGPISPHDARIFFTTEAPSVSLTCLMLPGLASTGIAVETTPGEKLHDKRQDGEGH